MRDKSIKKHSRFKGLRWRILLAMSLAGLGPLIIMAYQGYHCAKEAVVTSKKAHLVSVAESRKAQLDSWFAEIKSNLKFLSNIPCTRKTCSNHNHGKHVNPCHFLMTRLEQHSCCFEYVANFCDEWRPTLPLNPQTSEAMSQIPQGFKERLKDKKGVVVSSPIKGKQGRFIYMGLSMNQPQQTWASYIVARVTLDKCATMHLLSRTGLGETGKAYLIFNENNRILSPSSPPNNPDTPFLLPEEMRIKNNKLSPAVEYTDFNGLEVLGAAAALPHLNSIVVADVHRDQAFAWFSILRSRALITGALTLAFVVILSITISSRLSSPLRKLAEVSKRIASGQHNQRLSLIGGKEAQDVGEAFNTMLDELAASNERLRHAASLAAVGEISTSIVHEMRNPLSSIKMNLKALQKKVEGDNAYTELAQIGMAQANRLETMLTDLLSYGKPLSLNMGSIDFDKLAADVSEVTKKACEEKGVTIKIENLLNNKKIPCDREQIWRALSNLALNAVQASPEGGLVSLRAQPSPNIQDMIALSVSDNGPGVDDALKDTLFIPFVTNREEGTGLGLANVKKIAEVHNGRVFFRNKEKGGAVFTILLPQSGSAS